MWLWNFFRILNYILVTSSNQDLSSFWVFIIFQNKKKLVTRILSLIIFILTWIGGGIRWFVSLRKIKVGSNESTLRKMFLLLYIIPIFGIPCNFFYDLYTSAILTILRPKYLHTMQHPQYIFTWPNFLNDCLLLRQEIAENEFHALLEVPYLFFFRIQWFVKIWALCWKFNLSNCRLCIIYYW